MNEDEDDVRWLEGGIVRVDTMELESTILYYLDRPAERAEVARRGLEIVTKHSTSSILQFSGEVERILAGRGCAVPSLSDEKI